MIGIASTSHLLQFSTSAFQAIKLFHDNSLLELIFFFFLLFMTGDWKTVMISSKSHPTR